MSGPQGFGGAPSASLLPSQFLDGLPGLIVPRAEMIVLTGGLSNVTAGDTLTWLLRFCPPRNLALAKFSFACIRAAQNNDTLDFGVYTVTDATHLSRLHSIGPTAGILNAASTSAPTVVNLGATWNLAAGTVYYAGFVMQATGTPAQVVGVEGSFVSMMNELFGSTFPNAESWYGFFGNTLPATISGGAEGPAPAPVLCLRES